MGSRRRAAGSSSPSADPRPLTDAPDPTPTIADVRAARRGTGVRWARPSDTVAVLARSGAAQRTYHVARELLAEAPLRPGDRVAAAALAELERRSEAVLARRRALALLARAMHSRRALAGKLTGGGFGTSAVQQALARLDELGYLDDAGYARLWVRSRVARGGDGRDKVLAGLLKHGISRRDAAAALDAEYPAAREADLCRRLAVRLLERHPADRRAGERVARQLAGRGFPGHLVIDALEDAAPGAGGGYIEME